MIGTYKSVIVGLVVGVAIVIGAVWITSEIQEARQSIQFYTERIM